MRDIVNSFRQEKLGLPALHTRQATFLMIDERVPYTYCWSPALVPKPRDWASHINVSGFFFLDKDATAATTQPKALRDFLGIGHTQSLSPPVYIGFGSITGHDSVRLLQVVLEALAETGDRALLSGLATDEDRLPETIFKIGSVPHDWLFQHGKTFTRVSLVDLHAALRYSLRCHSSRRSRNNGRRIASGETDDHCAILRWSVLLGQCRREAWCRTSFHSWKGSHHERLGRSVEIRPRANDETSGWTDSRCHLEREGLRWSCASLSRSSATSTNAQWSRIVVRGMLLPERLSSSTLSSCHTSPADCWSYRWITDLSSSDTSVDLHVWQSGACSISWHRQTYTTRHCHFHFGYNRWSETSITLPWLDQWSTTCDSGTGQGSRQGSRSSWYWLFVLVWRTNRCVQPTSITLWSIHVSPVFPWEILGIKRASVILSFREQEFRSRPYITNYESGIDAALIALYQGWIESMLDFSSTSRIAYERHGQVGSVAGTLIAVANSLIKPLASTLASVTWLGRGIYASVNALLLSDRGDEACTDNTLGLDLTRLETLDDDEQVIRTASEVTSYSPEVCQQILSHFDEVKRRRGAISHEDSSWPRPNHSVTVYLYSRIFFFLCHFNAAPVCLRWCSILSTSILFM